MTLFLKEVFDTFLSTLFDYEMLLFFYHPARLTRRLSYWDSINCESTVTVEEYTVYSLYSIVDKEENFISI